MILYALPPIIEEATDHWVIDDPNNSAHKEIFSSTAIYIIEEKEKSFYLNSYSLNGTWIGDTWHQTIEDAKHQAEFEYKDYGKPNIEWIQIPDKEENPIKYVLSLIASQSNQYFCPCCGYKTLYMKPAGTFNICKICFWEDDLVQFDDPDYKGGANEVSLHEARENFKKFGASDKSNLKHVRKPTKLDIRNTDWEKLGYPLD